MVLEGHEEGEESLGRDSEGLQQVPLLEYPGDDDIAIMINVEEDNGDESMNQGPRTQKKENLKVVQVRTRCSRMMEFAVKTSRPQVLMFDKILSSSSCKNTVSEITI